MNFADSSARYCDFFRLLYQTIQQRLQGELANRWEDASIEFIFSVPTTWKPVPTVERFRSTVQRAGFGRYPNHKCDIGLTEAEAAAVHTARVFPKLFKESDVLLVCDVGGGTTVSFALIIIVSHLLMLSGLERSQSYKHRRSRISQSRADGCCTRLVSTPRNET
jgi:hypothetical protein